MPTFIDESGDPGPGANSSDYFHLAAVWFETIEDVIRCKEAIVEVRKIMGVGSNFVFHSCETRSRLQQTFYLGVAEQKFRFVGLTVDKRMATKQGVKLSKELIQESASKGVAAELFMHYRDAEDRKGQPLKESVLVHHHDDGRYIGRIEAAFRSLKSPQNPNKSLVKYVRTARAESDDLIQLADMVCALVRKQFEGDRDNYRLLESKRIAVKTWP